MKCKMSADTLDQDVSLPLRECGLKFPDVEYEMYLAPVTPLAGVWIEINTCESIFLLTLSHSPCGSVD